MAKGKYSAMDFQAWFDREEYAKFESGELVLGVDVAKIAFYAAITEHGSNVYDVVYFERDDIRLFIEKLAALELSEVTLVMEPTGTYGDPLLEQAHRAGLKVERINGDRVTDARRVFDGTDSLHDGKAAYLLAHLYKFGVGDEWEEPSESKRQLRALADIDELVEKTEDRFRNVLEGVLARHWPEVADHVGLTSTALLELLIRYGGPDKVAADAENARELMRKASRKNLTVDTIDKIIESARQTQGRATTEAEREKIRYIAGMLRQSRKRSGVLKRQLEEVAEEHEDTRNLADFAGSRTALVIVGMLGKLTDYDNPDQLEKAAGLNLCERSSGRTSKERQNETKGLHISKAGPGRVRKMLYWLVMRVINPVQSDTYCPYATAWYHERKRRNGGQGLKAMVALMRKLIRALWWIARGKEYDGTKLFDVARLRKLGHL